VKSILLAIPVFAILAATPVLAADGCGPGCHATFEGACVVDGWGIVLTSGMHAR
jgi:hypothetical protein